MDPVTGESHTLPENKKSVKSARTTDPQPNKPPSKIMLKVTQNRISTPDTQTALTDSSNTHETETGTDKSKFVVIVNGKTDISS